MTAREELKTKDYSTSFTVDQSPDQVFDAINNVRGWWSGEIDGRTDELGAVFTYRYQDAHRSTQKITELVPGRRVVWRVLDAQINFVKDQAEWNGTDIVFEIAAKGGKTELRFTHVGLAPTIECYGKCAGAWGFYINDSLRRLITTGKGDPNDKESRTGARARNNGAATAFDRQHPTESEDSPQRKNETEQERHMATSEARHTQQHKGHLGMDTPPIVSPQAWEAARQQMLVKEKSLMRARDALAAERRRMPWMAVDKAYEFEGPNGKVSLLDLFEGRRQLIVYRAFFEPDVFGWSEHAWCGCSLGADQVAHLAHLNARDTTLAYASRAPQADIARLKARMGWEMPWYTITDSFDADFGVDEWHGHNVLFRDGERVFRTYFVNSRGDEAMGTTWSYLDITPLGRQETWEDSPEGYPQTPPYKWWNWHDNYSAAASPDPKWVEASDAGEAAFRKRDAEDPKPA